MVWYGCWSHGWGQSQALCVPPSSTNQAEGSCLGSAGSQLVWTHMEHRQLRAQEAKLEVASTAIIHPWFIKKGQFFVCFAALKKPEISVMKLFSRWWLCNQSSWKPFKWTSFPPCLKYCGDTLSSLENVESFINLTENSSNKFSRLMKFRYEMVDS